VKVATQSFTCEYDGETIAVHRGERFSDDHEVVARFPYRFQRDASARNADEWRDALARFLEAAERR
jgi:hypothetical protein